MGNNTLLLFCEGVHDAAFCHIVLKHILNAQLESPKPLNQYQWPLSEIFKKSAIGHSLGESDNIVQLPWNSYLIEEYRIIIFTMGGQALKPEVKNFLKSTTEMLYGKGKDFPNGEIIGKVKVLFVFDADHLTVGERMQKWETDFSSIGHANWQINDIVVQPGYNGAVSGNKAVFVWHINNATNTLEDLLIDILRDVDAFPIVLAENFVSTIHNWSWQASNTRDLSAVSAKHSKRQKVILSIAGQYHRPAAALGPIIQACVKQLGSDRDCPTMVEKIKQNSHACNFANFIKSYLEMEWQ